MGDSVDTDDIDDDAYVSVELKINGSIVNIKKKRLLLKSQRDLFAKSESKADKKVKKSRSRSIEKKKKRSRSNSSNSNNRKDKHR